MPEHKISGKLADWTAVDMGCPLCLTPVRPGGVPPELRDWDAARASIREAWGAIMGRPEYDGYARREILTETFDAPTFTGRVYRQTTGPHAAQCVVVLEPKNARYDVRPGVVVPFYHPDKMMGFDLQKKTSIAEDQNIQFARHLVEQGWVAVCCEAFPYNTVPDPRTNESFAWWKAASKKLLADHPRWTGIGKLTADVGRAVDLLLAQPRMDAARIAMIGHSLGGKMAFTAGALDERIKAVVASDFGMGWDFSNWDAPWYYGPQVRNPGFKWGNHHLLAAMAPRSFLLVGGEFDKPESYQYLVAARPAYRLYGREHAVGFIHHATGHRPPLDAMCVAYQWLHEQLDCSLHE